MNQQNRKLTNEQIVNNLGDIRAPFITAEIQGEAFKPARHPLYLEYALELLRQLLPVAALEKAYVGTTLDHMHDMPDHLVCNRAVNLMTSMVDKALYERFKVEHPEMPKQLTAREWPTYMMQMRFNDWHSGVPVYPSAASGLDSATPLDFISEEQGAMAHASRLDVAVLDRDPFDVAVELRGGYPNTSLAALVLVVNKAQSKLRVARVVDKARGPSSTYVFHATIQQAEQGVDAAATSLGIALSVAEREAAVHGLYLAPPAAAAA